MATLSSKMLPAGVATLAQGALADTSVQPNDSPAFDALTVNGNAFPSAGALSNRNLIVNGAMQVAQRGTSTAGVTASGYFVADRFRFGVDALGTHTITQASDGPAGFAKSYKIEVTTANASPAASSSFVLDQRIEGQNLQLLKKGTVDAESVTLSFWVKSNKTGTYNLEFEDITNLRNIIAAYTVDASATWEYKTITFAGDTSGALIADNAQRARVLWWLGAGTDFTSGTRNTTWAAQANANRAVGNVNLADTIGNTWQITGVQLELGTTATPFEHRSFGPELALCQRYARTYPISRLTMCPEGSNGDNTQAGIQYAPMRITPTSTTLTTPSSTVNGVGQGAVPTFAVAPQSITDAIVQAQGITASSYGASVLLTGAVVFLDAEL
jgi:hypothetical protein